MESAVSNVVGRLLPGVITTTRHARMYSLHTLAWSIGHERNLDQAQAEEFLRRCEVVIAGIHHFHDQHRVACRACTAKATCTALSPMTGSTSPQLPSRTG